MNQQDTLSHLRIARARRNATIAGVVFFVIIGLTGLAFLSVISGSGSGPDRGLDGLALVPILVLGALAAGIVGLIWFTLFLQIVSEKRDLEEAPSTFEADSDDIT